jgi:hypothetical protein
MWRRLCAGVAVPRMGGEQTGIVTPLTFQVIGDGRTLWESDRVLEYDKPQSFDINVSGVDILHLKVICPGWCSYARAVWLDPFLQNPEKVPAQKGFQKPAPERVPVARPARRAGVNRGALWRVEGDELIKEGLGHGIVKFGDRGWTDYDLTFEARKTAEQRPTAPCSGKVRLICPRGEPSARPTWMASTSSANRHGLNRTARPYRGPPQTLRLLTLKDRARGSRRMATSRRHRTLRPSFRSLHELDPLS